MTNITAQITARRCLLLIFPLYAVLALWMGQDANWDLKNYHWYNGYALLNGRFGFDMLPSQTPYFYNPAFDALFYAVASQVPSWIASVLLSLLQALNALLLFKFTKRLLRPDLAGRDWYAAGAAALAVLGGGTLAELGTVFYDNVVSLGVFTSLYLAQRALVKRSRPDGESTINWASLVVAGIPVGIGTGFKLPTAIFCVGLCGGLLLMPGSLRERITRAFAFGCGVLLGLAIGYGFWGAYLWRDFQNPLFPYFNNIFQSPVTVATSARDVNFVPEGGWLRLVFPFAWTLDPKLVGEVPFRDLKLPLLYALLPIVAVMAWRTRHALGRLTAPLATYPLFVIGVAYAAWLFMFAIYRYAVPLEMLAAPCLLIAIDRVFTTLRVKQVAIALALIACLCGTQVGDWGRTAFGPRMVTVDWPSVLHESDPAQTMILMAGFQPYSHVVPSLPPQIPVIRIQSNFASPGEAKGINDQLAVRVRDWLETPTHKVLFLIPVYDADWVGNAVLPQFGLKLRLENCQIAHPNFNEDLRLCPLDRL